MRYFVMSASVTNAGPRVRYDGPGLFRGLILFRDDYLRALHAKGAYHVAPCAGVGDHGVYAVGVADVVHGGHAELGVVREGVDFPGAFDADPAESGLFFPEIRNAEFLRDPCFSHWCRR